MSADEVEAARVEFRRTLAQYEDGWRCDMPLSAKQFEDWFISQVLAARRERTNR